MFVDNSRGSFLALRPEENRKKQDDVSEVNSFADEVLLQIFSFLSPVELLQVSGVSTHWKAVAFDPTLWRNFSAENLSFPGDKQGAEAYKHSKIAHRAFTERAAVRSFFLEKPVYRCKHYYEPLRNLEDRLVRQPTSLIVSGSSVIASLKGRRNYFSLIYKEKKAGFQPGITYRWDLKSGKLCSFYKDLSEGILALASNGKQLAALLKDEVKICDLDSGELLSSFKIDERRKQQLTWCGDQLIISYQLDEKNFIVETRDGITGSFNGFAKRFSGKGLKLYRDKVITHDKLHVYIYDRRTNQRLYKLKHPRHFSTSHEASNRNKIFAFVDKILQKIIKKKNEIIRLDLCNNRVVTTANDGTRIWDVESGKQLAFQKAHFVATGFFQQRDEELLLSGDKIFTSTKKGEVRIYNFKSGELVQRYQTKIPKGSKCHLHVTKDSLVFNTTKGIKVLSLKQKHVLLPNSPLQEPYNPPLPFKIALERLAKIDQISQLIKSIPYIAADTAFRGFFWVARKIGLRLFLRRG